MTLGLVARDQSQPPSVQLTCPIRVVHRHGPLGVGKSTLAEGLSEAVTGCVHLDGDHLIAANPPADNEEKHLHSTIALLVEHHRSFGYRHFVANHLWTAPQALADLRDRLAAPNTEFRCVRLILDAKENLRRIHLRSEGRVLDELDFELRTMTEERAAFERYTGTDLGEPFDVLVDQMVGRLGLS